MAPHPRIKQQLHVRSIIHLMQLRLRQGRQIGREHDVVAAAAPAAEGHIRRRLAQLLQPVTALTHIYGRLAVRKPRQPCAAMRRGNRHHMGGILRPLTGAQPLEPSPHHQPAHAMRYQKWSYPRMLHKRFDALIQIFHHGFNRATVGWLQGHGRAGNAACLEPAQPDGPHATVAEIAMHQYHAHLPLHLLALAIHRHSIGLCMLAKRNLPAEQPPGPAPLGKPGPQRDHGRRQRQSTTAQHRTHHQHLRAELQPGSARNQPRTQQCHSH